MKIKRQEIVSFYSHFAGFVGSIIGTVVLLLSIDNRLDFKIVSIIYGVSISLLFLASSLYHAFKKEENGVSIWRKLDHLAIFFMIAGTYTPISYIYLPEKWKWGIIIAEWSIVALGLIIKIFFMNIKRWIYTSLYIFMGWIAIFPMKFLLEAMDNTQIFLLFGGGLLFTIGAIIYGLKKPNIKEGFFGFHEIFHLFILAGAILHYIMVFNSMSANRLI